jgi:purine nucleosidase
MQTILILDTDMDTDCDDAGALALAMLFHRQGQLQLGAVICDPLSPWPAAYTRAALDYYGLSAIPVGLNSHCHNSTVYNGYIEQLRAKDFPFYNEAIARREGLLPGQVPGLVDAIALYRRVLAASADQQVVICAVGLLTLLPALLDSGPCAYSPLPGRELVARKVRELVSMAKAPFPAGVEAFNWRMDSPHAADAIARWPGPITVSFYGDEILTLPPNTPPDNPIHSAYRIWQRGKTTLHRASWDLIAVLWAAQQHGELFLRRGPASLRLDPRNAHYHWELHDSAGMHGCLYPNADNDAITAALQNLLKQAANLP